MYARWPRYGWTTGSDSSGKPASAQARQTRLSRWSEASERYAERRRVTSGDGDEPAAVEEDLAAAELRGEPVRREVALVDLPARAVVEDPLLLLLGLDVVAQGGVDDDELARDAARLGEEALAVVALEVAVEVRR